MNNRHAFFISDSTGQTAENLGNALLAQFENTQFTPVYMPYTDTKQKARAALLRIRSSVQLADSKPLIFSSILSTSIRETIAEADGFVIDIFGSFLPGLEEELQEKSMSHVGKSHANPAEEKAMLRIDAVNYALDNDDGMRVNRYGQADIVLVGVSRSAKTPTCLYMGMQYGIFAANYPLTEEDLEDGRFPEALLDHKDKLFALTIAPERLSAIRNERRSGSKYASLRQCEWEVKEAESLYRKLGLKKVITTHLSVEEIGAHILVETGLVRRL